MPVVETLFGPMEFADPKPKAIRFKTIKAVYETLTVREPVGNYLNPSTRYTAPSQIHDTFSFLRQETREYFFALHLDGKNRIICLDMVSQGSLNQTIVHPRDLYKTALLSSAAALILLHNHPTGDPTPSQEDIQITRRLIEAGELLGIKVLDHIIVGDRHYSFVEGGLI